MTPDTPRIELGHQEIQITFTGLDVRDRIFTHYHQVEESPEHQAALAHGMPLVYKEHTDPGNYWVRLGFSDLPDIYYLDEPHGRYRGIPLQEALDRTDPNAHHQVRLAWHEEHFITATWRGSQVPEFIPLWTKLLEVLGLPYTTTPVQTSRRPYGTPQDLIAIGAFLQQWPQRNKES